MPPTRLALLSAGLLLLGACVTSTEPEDSTTVSGRITTVVMTSTTAPPATEVTITPTSMAATTTTAPPATTTTSTNDLAEGSGCTPGTDTLPDGLWYGEATALGERGLEFDLACWFVGDAATAAAAEDGEESPPPNDYYVRNQSDRIRSLTVTLNAPVTWYPEIGVLASETTITYAEWRTLREQRDFQLAVWLEVEDGTVVSIVEQWVP
jgi:hypothetical protein